MLKKTINYTDFDGKERSEEFYFNLTKAEITEMDANSEGGMLAMLNKIADEKDSKRIVEVLKDIILRSYGQKSADGKRFIKNQQLRDEFSQTNAYSELFIELGSSAEASAAFVNGIIPAVPQNLNTNSI